LSKKNIFANIFPRKIDERGQFFSPDVIIAVGIFIFGLVLFFSASNAVFAQANLINERRSIDEAIHPILDSLILSQGTPKNWETKSIGDINSIGLVWTNNCLDADKLMTFKGLLDNSYTATKQVLGIGSYDIYFEVADNKGNILQLNGVDLNSGIIVDTPKQRLSYQRMVCFNNSEYVFETVVSFEG